MSQHASKPIENLYYAKEAAEFLRIDEKTLAKWRSLGIGPRFIKISSRAIRYEESELRRYMAERARHSTWDFVDSAATATSSDGTGKQRHRDAAKESPG